MDFWFFFSYFIKNNLKNILTTTKQKMKTFTDVSETCNVPKLKNRNTDLINTFWVPSRPPEIKLTTLLHRNLGLDLYSWTALNWGISVMQKPGKLCLLVSARYHLWSFSKQSINSPALLSPTHVCGYTYTCGYSHTYIHIQDLLSFVDNLQTTSGNSLQDSTELRQIAPN